MAIVDFRNLRASPNGPQALEAASDHDLLNRFAAVRDQDAFAELVRRHGAMLLRLCRRVLHHGQDAEDVCQAAFLLLAQQAGSPRWHASVNGWLFQVAYRLSLEARTAATRRSRHEARAKPATPCEPLDEVTFRELQAIFDDELSRLPEKYRAPILLCCLEGRTREEAARCLGWSLPTVKDRLEQGRERLRARLAQRGLPLGTALLSTWLLGSAAPAAQAGVLLPFKAHTTATAALAIATGKARLVDYLPARLAFIAQGATTTMLTRTLIAAASALLLFGLGAAGIVAAVQGNSFPMPAPVPASVTVTGTPAQPPQPQPVPLPAVLPLGGHRGAVRAVALDQSGKMLATVGVDKTVRVWDLATGLERQRLDLPGEAGSVAFSADGKKLAALSGGPDGALIVWDPDSGKQLWRSGPGPKGDVTSGAVAFAPGGNVLAAQLDGGTVMFDVPSGKMLSRIRLQGDRDPPALAFSPAGDSLAILDGDGALVLMHARDGRLLAKLPARQPILALAYVADGKVAAADGGRHVRIVDPAIGKDEAPLQGPDLVNLVTATADGKWIATAGPSGAVLLWDMAARKQERRFMVQGTIHALALGSGGKLLATAGDDGAMVWDLTRDEKPLPKDLKLTAKELEVAWSDLASDEGAKAYAAARLLRADPARALPFLESHLKPPIEKPSPEKLKQLITDMGAAQFKKRDAATKELVKLGALAEPALRAALADNPVLEVKNRLERLLKLLDGDGKPLTLDQQREVRAIRVLERIEGTQAQQMLQALTQESPGWWVRQEAQAALKRLGQAGKVP
jgi:RNA polymerase sigma factor (sigma-70 family)